MKFKEQFVQRDQHRIYAREYAGAEPAIILMHGFPDNLHLYDRLLPYLAARRIVTFDFLGWGSSDKPLSYPYTAKNQEGDLDAVVKQLELGQVVPVAHDASGIFMELQNHPRAAPSVTGAEHSVARRETSESGLLWPRHVFE